MRATAAVKAIVDVAERRFRSAAMTGRSRLCPNRVWAQWAGWASPGWSRVHRRDGVEVAGEQLSRAPIGTWKRWTVATWMGGGEEVGDGDVGRRTGVMGGSADDWEAGRGWAAGA